MKRIVLGVLAFGLVAALALPASAQNQRKGQGLGKGQGRPGQGFGQGPGGMMMGMGRGGGAMLLANPGVQKELKLTDEQLGKAETWVRDQQGKTQERMQSLRDASAEERREAMAKYEAETKKAIAEILKPEQMKRFDQIHMQQMGIAAFMDETVVKALKITDDQREKVREIQMAMMTEMRESFQPGGGGDPQANMAKMNTLRKTTFDKAVALMTADQKAAWKDLIGEPYEVKFEPRRRID